jgi:hypothetical protein
MTAASLGGMSLAILSSSYSVLRSFGQDQDCVRERQFFLSGVCVCQLAYNQPGCNAPVDGLTAQEPVRLHRQP